MDLNENKPLISIAMCLYNGQEFLEEALSSINNLKYPNYELIILDNQSSDESINIVKKNILKNNKIKLIIDSKKRNGYDGYTEIIRYCKGEYFINFNDDDSLYEDSLDVLLDALIENKSDGIFSNGYLMDKEGKKKKLFFYENFQFNKFSKEVKILNFFKNRYNAPFLFGLFKKDLILKVLPYENIDQTLQDTDTLFVGKILNRMNISYCPSCTINYRQYDVHERWHDPKHGNLNYMNNFISRISFQLVHEISLLKKYLKLLNSFHLIIYFYFILNIVRKIRSII